MAKKKSVKTVGTQKAAAKKAVKKVASTTAVKKAAVKKAAAKKAIKKAASTTSAKKAAVKKGVVKQRVKKTATGKTAAIKTLQTVEFRCYSPSSGIVEVAGDFNDWTPTKTPMKKNDRGYWSVKVKLSAGRYQYKFVFDGTSWELDPNAPTVGSAYDLNNVLEIN